MIVPYGWESGSLAVVEAACVALPGAGAPGWVRRFATAHWALVLPGSIILVIGGLALAPGAADGLTWLALLAIPPLAALALGWGMRWARPPLAAVAGALLAVALTSVGTTRGDVAAGALTALSVVPLARLLVAAAPALAVEAGLVVLAAVDSVLVFSDALREPNDVLVAAAPGPGLPQLQSLALHGASLGYGDVFAAAVLGALQASRGASPWPASALTLALLLAWQELFYVVDQIPATVPPAVALLILRAWPALRRRSRGRPARAR